MTGALISAVVTLVLALGSAIAWWVKRRDTKSDPIPRSAAEVAMSRQALGIIQASAKRLEEDVKRLSADREADRLARETDRCRIDALEAGMAELRSSWTTWYSDLRDRWHHHREQPNPPAPPHLD